MRAARRARRRTSCARAADGAQRRRARRDARRPGRAAAPPAEVDRRSPSCSAPASAKALNGRAVLPDDLPCVTGSIGLLGTKPSYDLMEGCDTLLMVGSSFPYSEWLPEPGQARGVQIDIDARLIGMRYPTEVNLVGDARRDAARAAAAARAQGGPRRWREEIEDERRALVATSSTTQAPARTPTRSTRSSSSTSCRRGCPTARSSPPTPARRRTGGRATCACGAGMDAALSGHARDDVPGGAVRARREVRASRTAR